MKRAAKLAFLGLCRALGGFRLIERSNWRRQRLLILCYHGVSLDDEHLWQPDLFMPPELFRERCQAIQASGLDVVSLEQGVRALRAGELTEPAVALTFDDGFCDFYCAAAPVMRDHAMRATVYVTTYYVDFQRPVFNLMIEYLFWKQRDEGKRVSAPDRAEASVEVKPNNWRDLGSRWVAFAEREDLSAEAKDELLRQAAEELELDYDAMLASRVLQLMTPRETAAVARQGFAVELHTHRHRTPNDEALFRREIRENRERLEAITGRRPKHFCYPSGVHAPEFLPWLRAEGVETATTCDPALASADDDPLSLPRKIDALGLTELEFEAWLTGFEPYLRR